MLLRVAERFHEDLGDVELVELPALFLGNAGEVHHAGHVDGANDVWFVRGEFLDLELPHGDGRVRVSDGEGTTKTATLFGFVELDQGPVGETEEVPVVPVVTVEAPSILGSMVEFDLLVEQLEIPVLGCVLTGDREFSPATRYYARAEQGATVG